MNKEIQRVLSLMMVGVGLSSPISSKSAEQAIDGDKTHVSGVGISDTTRGVETSDVLSEAEKKIIDIRFKSFLEGEGKYNESELEKSMFYYYNPRSKADLGFCGLNGIETVVQGMLLGHFSQDNKEYLAVGVKNKENKRVISLVEFPVKETMKAYGDVVVVEMVGGASSTSYAIKSLATIDDVNLFLEEKTDQVVLFNLFNVTKEDLESREFKALDAKKSGFYLDFVFPRIDSNSEFISGLLMPQDDALKAMRESEQDYIGNIKGNEEMVVVENYSDVKTVLDGHSGKLPLLSYVTYNKYIH
jgi:hypothetical protein